MGLWQSFRRWFRGDKPAQSAARGRRGHGRDALYDAAQNGEDNRRHWLQADAYSGQVSNTHAVRKVIRERARYEAANNGYCGGLIDTLANDLIGTGPTLQVLLDDPLAQPTIEDRLAASKFNREIRQRAKQVEEAFDSWAERVKLAEVLHIAKMSKTRCGEVFILLTSDPTYPDVQLDLQVIETDRITDPSWADSLDSNVTDGIVYDERGKPMEYRVLIEHPGDTWSRDFVTVPGKFMIHWWKQKRPGELRQVSEINASLGLFAQLRRWTLATLCSAEAAANISGVLETTGDADTSDPELDEDGRTVTNQVGSTIAMERNAFLTLPKETKLHQLEAAHPASTYEIFKRELVKEAGRPVSAPYCVSAGDGSVYNFSSIRADRTLLYRPAVNVEREHCRRNVLERIFAAWIQEAVLIPGLLPDGIRPDIKHVWHWPGFAAIEPDKETQVTTDSLANCTRTLAEACAEKENGLTDWEDVLRQKAREQDLADELGIDLAPPEKNTNGDAAANPQPASPDNGMGSQWPHSYTIG